MRAFIMSALLIAFALVGYCPQARADKETNFLITVKARDAKFIGTAAGGAQIVIRDRRTGDIITNGTTYGNTGDTATIMADSHKRDETLIGDGSARYEFSLEFWDPLPVTITATAPVGQPQSMVSVSEDMILLPGKDYTTGNGIMLELPGFAVDVVSPRPNSKYKLDAQEPPVIEANVMKLCGCQVAKDSPWPPERYQVEVNVYKDNLFITSMELPYADEPGLYKAKLKVPMAGIYRLVVTAFDPQTKEAGMDATTIIFEE